MQQNFPETLEQKSGLVQTRLLPVGGRVLTVRAMSQRDGDLAAGAHPEEGDRHAVRMDGSDDELDQPVSAATRSSVLCHRGRGILV